MNQYGKLISINQIHCKSNLKLNNVNKNIFTLNWNN